MNCEYTFFCEHRSDEDTCYEKAESCKLRENIMRELESRRALQIARETEWVQDDKGNWAWRFKA